MLAQVQKARKNAQCFIIKVYHTDNAMDWINGKEDIKKIFIICSYTEKKKKFKDLKAKAYMVDQE